MDNEHGSDENGLLLIIDVDGRTLRAHCAFCSGLIAALGDRDVDSCLDWLVLIIRVLDLEV